MDVQLENPSKWTTKIKCFTYEVRLKEKTGKCGQSNPSFVTKSVMEYPDAIFTIFLKSTADCIANWDVFPSFRTRE